MTQNETDVALNKVVKLQGAKRYLPLVIIMNGEMFQSLEGKRKK